MVSYETDMKADTNTPEDRQEAPLLMEPLLIAHASRQRLELNDLVVELVSRSSALYHSLPEGVAKALADLVRAMNCYYSNLIEGHDTHPVDIERALNENYSTNPEKRDLQLEAKAHFAVQQWIDEGHLRGQETSIKGLCALHQRFCETLPETLLWTYEPKTGGRIQIKPGAFRRRDVIVGGHVAISPGAVPRFMKRFEQVWGLARNEGAYKGHLAACDQKRRNDLDGRGPGLGK